MHTLEIIARDIPIVFPVHPRTRQRLAQLELVLSDRVQLIEPLGYLDFLALESHATLVITDSGGVQEETTFLRVPCLTVRENTERPITVTQGSNLLVGQNTEQLRQKAAEVLSRKGVHGQIPPLWDGKASERIAAIILKRQP
jgi:UDP-N-acetylglucosamine 2-epimerase (non-hydrolysing)